MRVVLTGESYREVREAEEGKGKGGKVVVSRETYP